MKVFLLYHSSKNAFKFFTELVYKLVFQLQEEFLVHFKTWNGEALHILKSLLRLAHLIQKI